MQQALKCYIPTPAPLTTHQYSAIGVGNHDSHLFFHILLCNSAIQAAVAAMGSFKPHNFVSFAHRGLGKKNDNNKNIKQQYGSVGVNQASYNNTIAAAAAVSATVW